MSEEAREAMYRQVGSKLLVGRVGNPEDVAEAYLFLMRERFITGEVIDVDGGRPWPEPSSSLLRGGGRVGRGKPAREVHAAGKARVGVGSKPRWDEDVAPAPRLRSGALTAGGERPRWLANERHLA
jgi:hypothetical protein